MPALSLVADISLQRAVLRLCITTRVAANCIDLLGILLENNERLTLAENDKIKIRMM
jgi:hypothetical protein